MSFLTLLLWAPMAGIIAGSCLPRDHEHSWRMSRVLIGLLLMGSAVVTQNLLVHNVVTTAKQVCEARP